MPKKYTDDKFVHLESDIEKIRKRYRQYISMSNEAAALEICKEILYNAIDECKNPRSPGNKIHIHFDDRSGFITVEDNGRGIPLDILEKVYTSLNMGSNIDSSDKADLNMDNLGLNGVGSLATCGLAERVTITSYRGGTENAYKTLVFEEGNKVDEHDGKCSADKHGMTIEFKPSKVMGNTTRIVWKDVHRTLQNLQYLGIEKITIDSIYIDKDGNEIKEKYKQLPFQDILQRNEKEKIISPIYAFTVHADDVDEDFNGVHMKRFITMDVAFCYADLLSPYIDSFSNSNNTIENGDHLDGAIEAIARYFHVQTRNMLSEKDRERLEVKWDDVRTGLSIAVSLHTNYEMIYTNQSKYRIVSSEVRKLITQLVSDKLTEYFGSNQARLKTVCDIVKMNAKARREGEKVRTAIVKSSMTNWSSYKMKNFDPCTNKGRTYKELFIVEGDGLSGLCRRKIS